MHRLRVLLAATLLLPFLGAAASADEPPSVRATYVLPLTAVPSMHPPLLCPDCLGSGENVGGYVFALDGRTPWYARGADESGSAVGLGACMSDAEGECMGPTGLSCGFAHVPDAAPIGHVAVWAIQPTEPCSATPSLRGTITLYFQP